MILDKLMEKKDLMAYLTYRTKVLCMNKDAVVKSEQPENREAAVSKIEGRIEELCRLKNVINSNSQKELSKLYAQMLKKDGLTEKELIELFHRYDNILRNQEEDELYDSDNNCE